MKNKIIKPIQRGRHRCRGFTLLEILVALLVLAIGLLGLAMLQTTSLKFNTDSYFNTQVTFLAYDMIDRMRANSAGALAGAYDVDDAAAAASKISAAAGLDCLTNVCTTGDLATWELGQWYAVMDDVLPGTTSTNRATIERIPATNLTTITIKWTERELTKSQAWEIQL